VEDCNKAIALNPEFVKAYYRKARALYELPHLEGSDAQVIDSLSKGLELARH
jgi:hypothetical protein